MIFFTSGFLSCYGFDDGDCIDELLFEHDIDFDFDLDEKNELLIHVIKTLVLPKLITPIETVEYATAHNPIRAIKINGVECKHLWDSEDDIDLIEPEFVEIDDAVIITMAKNFLDKR